MGTMNYMKMEADWVTELWAVVHSPVGHNDGQSGLELVPSNHFQGYRVDPVVIDDETNHYVVVSRLDGTEADIGMISAASVGVDFYPTLNAAMRAHMERTVDARIKSLNAAWSLVLVELKSDLMHMIDGVLDEG